VQGNNGGENIIDTVRGALNEGGLYGKRAGWHLPGFPTSSWASVTLPYNFGHPQVAWFTTTFNLNAPSGVDQSIGVQIKDTTKDQYRAVLFINGWQFDRYGEWDVWSDVRPNDSCHMIPLANNLGPQTVFYVPQGILNYQGTNTIAVAIIPLQLSALQSPQITLTSLSTTTTDLSVATVNSPSYTPRTGYDYTIDTR
jgi:Beta-galactosidase jelly roll domain